MPQIATRPALLKALGNQQPPVQINVDGESFTRLDIFKHDSWAATALYQSTTSSRKIVCKFNRQQSVLGFPLRWLGRWLARREADHYLRLSSVAGVPAGCGAVSCGANVLRYAVAHEFVEGTPLGKNEVVSEEFDRKLADLMAAIHCQDVAYVDFHKRENIIIGLDGSPYLIDFQVSWMLPRKRQVGHWWAAWLLKKLQALDQYHLEMHLAHHQRLRGQQPLTPRRPTWVKAHRLVTVPLRQFRRWLLVKLGIRQGRGDAASEHFPEQAFR